MIKNKLIVICLTAIFLVAATQIAIFCHASLYGQKLAFLEDAIGEQEKQLENNQLQLSQKTSLAELTRFAAQNGYHEPLEILMIVLETPVAFKSK